MRSLSFRTWLAPAVLALLALGGAHAGPYTFVPDDLNDSTGPNSFEVYGIGYRVESGKLDVYVATNFPKTGENGTDSYSSNGHFLPGDLYLNVGGSHNLGTGTVYGLGVTTHSGNGVTTDPSEKTSLAWKPVTAGTLYGNAVFSTGTYEDYPYAGYGGSPYDGDGNSHENSYPTLIADYGSNLGAQTFGYNAVTGKTWDYEISTSIDLATIGLYDKSFEIWWTMGCGNDAAKACGYSPACPPPVPEPTTFAVLGLGGLAGLLRRRRAA